MNNDGLRVGSVAGVPIYIQRSWLLIALVVLVTFAPSVPTARLGWPSWAAYAIGAAYALLLLLSVLAHEVGHALAAKAFHRRVHAIVATLWGGHTTYDGGETKPIQSALIALAGPAVNAVIGAVAFAVADATTSPLIYLLLAALAYANAFVAIFNILPGMPLDGGHVVEAVIWAVTGRRSLGTRVAGWCGLLVAAVVVWWFAVRPWLAGASADMFMVLWVLMIAYFLVQGAMGAIRAGQARERIAAVSLRSVLQPVVVVPLTASAQALTALVASHPQAVAAVAVDPLARPVGLLDVHALTTVPPEALATTSVAAFLRRMPDGWVVSADPDREDISGVVEAISEQHQAAGSPQLQQVVVTDQQGRVAGLVTVPGLNATAS